jgi:hypothetical protein
MAPIVLTDLSAEVAATVGVMESATTFIDGSAARLEAAVLKALENGATAEQLAPITAEVSALKAQREELAASIANQPTDIPVDPNQPNPDPNDPAA